MLNLNTLLKDIDTTLSAEIKTDGPCIDIPKVEELKQIPSGVLWGKAAIVCINFGFVGQGEDIAEMRKLNIRKLLQDEIYILFKDEPIYRDITSFQDWIYVILNTPLKDQVSQTLELIAKLNSMMSVLLIKLRGKRWPEIKWEIGVTYGDICMVSNCGTAISWFGKAFIEAKNIAKTCKCLVRASNVFVDNLKPDYQKFFTDEDGVKTASVINIAINQWVKENS